MVTTAAAAVTAGGRTFVPRRAGGGGGVTDRADAVRRPLEIVGAAFRAAGFGIETREQEFEFPAAFLAFVTEDRHGVSSFPEEFHPAPPDAIRRLSGTVTGII